MAVPVRDLEILKLFRRYVFLRARQVQGRLISHDDDCAITRSRLRRLTGHGWLRKHSPKMVDPLLGNSTAPIYTITTQGASVLAAQTGDISYLLAVEPSFSQWMALNHYCALSALHMIIDSAVASQDYVKETELIFEHEVADAEAKDPTNRYRLHTTVSKTGEKTIFFCPDSAFETEVKSHRRAWFIEYETGSDTPKRVFAKKHKGIAGFSGCLKTIFPSSKDFRVIFFCPNASWRDALRKEFAGKSGSEYCLFCATPEATREAFLHEQILYTAEKGPIPFVPRPYEASG